MGFFKKIFGSTADDPKKSFEDSKNEMLKGLNDSQKEVLGSLGIKSSKSKSSDENVRVKIGTLTDGVLVIKEGLKRLKEDSLEDYKNLRKIVFPSTLSQLAGCAIDNQERLEELDFSKVTLLTRIPEDFISGKTKIKTFIVPEGVRAIGDDFMDKAPSLKELYIPSTVTSVKCIGTTGRNSVDVYLYAGGLDLEDMEDQVKTFYVLAQDYDEYVEQLQEYESDARIRTMPEEKISFYSSTPMEEQVPSKATNTKSDAKHKVNPNTSVPSAEKETEGGKKIWWVNDLSVIYDGKKYALQYTGGKGQITKFVYDDVDILNIHQLRTAQKQANGSVLYGVACTCGGKFYIANCEHPVIDFLDGDDAVLAVDEDGDEYAIDRWGRMIPIEKYADKVREDIIESEKWSEEWRKQHKL
jgi:hypothetical protein